MEGAFYVLRINRKTNPIAASRNKRQCKVFISRPPRHSNPAAQFTRQLLTWLVVMDVLSNANPVPVPNTPASSLEPRIAGV
jgi:hypothetical protein